ncbi:MAG: hypothetical protein ACT4QC_18035 [Planctomycetaceae bacterium]
MSRAALVSAGLLLVVIGAGDPQVTALSGTSQNQQAAMEPGAASVGEPRPLTDAVSSTTPFRKGSGRPTIDVDEGRAVRRNVFWETSPNDRNPFGLIPTEWTTHPQQLPTTWDVETVFAGAQRKR